MASPAEHPLVAVVTGANKGIGYEIALKLCRMMWEADEKHTGAVYVCSRDAERGQQAVQKLEEKYKGIPRLLQLDVEDETSVTRAAGIIKQEQSHIDALVLNAGFAFKQAAPEPHSVQFPKTFSINYYGVRRCLDAMLPLMGQYGRVVIVAATAGRFAWNKTNDAARQKLMKAQSPEELDKIAAEMLETAKRESFEKDGWAPTAYGNSKLLVARLTQIEAEQEAKKNAHILVNCCCPGWCKSDMAGWENPTKTAEQGAEIPFMLCMLSRQSTVTGKFYENGQDNTYLKL